MLGLVETNTPAVMETHGGAGRLFRACYSDIQNGTIEQCVDWMRRNGTAGIYALHTLYPGAIIGGQRVIEYGWTERGGVYWRGEKV